MSPDFDFQAAFDRLHDRMNDMSTQITEVRTKVVGLVGNGQPGAIQILQSDVSSLKEWRSKQTGIVAAISTLIGFLGFASHFVWDLLRGKH